MAARNAVLAAESLSNSVEIIAEAHGWIVRVTENDTVLQSAEFELEAFAISYAEGQRIRLGVPEVIRARDASRHA